MTPNTHSASIEYATKADLNELRLEIRADLAEQLRSLESSLNKTIITTLLAMTAMFSTLIAVLKLFT